MAFIYGIQHPITKDLKYIGKTSNKLNDRLSYHLWYAKRPGKKNIVYAWIKSLLDKGLRPEIYLIEECAESAANDREIYWIKFYRDSGINLKNVQNGGDGQPKGYQFKKRHVPEKGKTPEHLKAYVGQAFGKRSDESKIRMKKAQSGIQRPGNWKKIISKDLKTGVEICFLSLTFASEFHKLVPTQISMRCRGKIKTPINNVMFAYASKSIEEPLNGQGIDKYVYIYQNNKLIYEFKTCTAAAKYFNLNRKSLSYRCNSDKLFDGMKWSFKCL